MTAVISDRYVPRTSFDVVGVGFIEGACDRAFNSNEFTCTSDHPVWVGTGVV